MSVDTQPGEQNVNLLSSWKEIAHYLQRNAATVRRWEKEEGLPVHRHSHNTRSSVYAYTTEIDAWRETRRLAAEPAPPVPTWRRLLTPSFAAVMLACLVMVGSLKSVDAEVGQTKILVCSGNDCLGGLISPDGRSMVAQKGGKLLIRNTVTKKDSVVAEVAQDALIDVRFSPDGSRLAYNQIALKVEQIQEGKLPEGQLYVVNRDGTDLRSLKFGGGFPIGWSSDGKKLLVRRLDAGNRTFDSLQWVTISNGAAQQVPLVHKDYVDVTLSWDGKHFAFLTGDADKQWTIHVTASDGSGENQLSPYSERPSLVSWSPDGRYVLFRQRRPAGLWAVRVVDGKIQGPAFDTHADVPPTATLRGIDRSGALYYQTVLDRVAQVTATLDPATGKATSAPQPLPLSSGESNNLLPRFSPDGHNIVFYRKPPNEAIHDLRIYSFDSGREQTLRTHAEEAGGPICWGQDGQSVVMNAWKEPTQAKGGQRLIEPVRLDLKTGEEKELFPDASSSFHMTDCSGDMIVGVDPAGIGLKVRNWRSGAENEIYRFAIKRQMDSQGPRFSRDGTQVAFFEQPDAETTTLDVISSSGGMARQLATAKEPDALSGYCTAWSPDNRFVYFCKHMSDGTTETFRVPANGGPAESTGYKGPSAGGIEISPDGTRIVTGWGRWQETQVWAIRNFLQK